MYTRSFMKECYREPRRRTSDAHPSARTEFPSGHVRRMHLPEVLRHLLHGPMPAAVVAGGNRGIAFRAVERAALQELLDALAVEATFSEVSGIFTGILHFSQGRSEFASMSG